MLKQSRSSRIAILVLAGLVAAVLALVGPAEQVQAQSDCPEGTALYGGECVLATTPIPATVCPADGITVFGDVDDCFELGPAMENVPLCFFPYGMIDGDCLWVPLADTPPTFDCTQAGIFPSGETMVIDVPAWIDPGGIGGEMTACVLSSSFSCNAGAPMDPDNVSFGCKLPVLLDPGGLTCPEGAILQLPDCVFPLDPPLTPATADCADRTAFVAAIGSCVPIAFPIFLFGCPANGETIFGDEFDCFSIDPAGSRDGTCDDFFGFALVDDSCRFVPDEVASAETCPEGSTPHPPEQGDPSNGYCELTEFGIVVVCTPPAQPISDDPADGCKRLVDLQFAGSDCPDGFALLGFVCALPPTTPTCDGLVVTIDMNSGASGSGTSGDDVMLGTPGDDTIIGGGGNDTICGGDGNDTIRGQAGDDTIFGEGGDDTIRGGSGDDELFGGDDADDVAGGTGDDLVSGDAGDDTKVRGGTGEDEVNGGAGNDLLVAGNGGTDTVDGGSGNDTVTGGPRPDIVRGGSGDDIVKGNTGADDIFGDAGNDELFGSGQPDTLDGGAGTDRCVGGTTGGGAPESDSAVNCDTVTQVP